MPNSNEIPKQEFLSLIQQTYEKQNVDEIAAYCTRTQTEVFRRELGILQQFGLKKELEMTMANIPGKEFAKIGFNDGKVSSELQVIGGSSEERIRDQQGKLRFRQKYRQSFFMQVLYRSQYQSQIEGQSCSNCGAPLRPVADELLCDYCGTSYQAEQVNWKLSRFWIENALKDLRKGWLIFIPILIIAFVTTFKLLPENQTEQLTLGFSFLTAGVILFLIIRALFKGILMNLRHNHAMHEIRRQDPHFSKELAQQRLLDILQMEPSINQEQATLVRSIQHFFLEKFDTNEQYQYLHCTCKVDQLKVHQNGNQTKIKRVIGPRRYILKRRVGVTTPVYYRPEQFTCPNCGSHDKREFQSEQICSYCGAVTPFEEIDWVLEQEI